jgi:hypothetical protein
MGWERGSTLCIRCGLSKTIEELIGLLLGRPGPVHEISVLGTQSELIFGTHRGRSHSIRLLLRYLLDPPSLHRELELLRWGCGLAHPKSVLELRFVPAVH